MNRTSADATGRARALCTLVPMTARAPGAIAILQLVGHASGILAQLIGIEDWPIHRARLVRFGDIDEGIAVRLTDDVAQLMPHGGPRVVQRLIAKLAEFGVATSPGDRLRRDVDPQALYPEAADRFEALALAAVARAASPLAIDLLLDQPRRWRSSPPVTDEDLARSQRLNRLIDPPIVVLAGPANVGKSTLSNALLGRQMSIAADVPGTTRDYTTGRIDLAGLVVDWHDTPGLRGLEELCDPIERSAIELASRLMASAEMLIAMTDHEHDWPRLPRQPDLRIANKADLGVRNDADLSISAAGGDGLAALVIDLKERLVPSSDLEHDGLWLFDERLVEKGS